LETGIKGPQMITQCANCGKTIKRKPFEIREHNFCSLQCLGEFRKKGKTVKCDVCGKPIYIPQSRFSYKNHFCSASCYGKWRSMFIKAETHPQFKSLKINCPVCGKSFYVQPWRLKRSRDICCSKECIKLLYRFKFKGENNPFYGKRHTSETKEKLSRTHQGSNTWNWKGGVSFRYWMGRDSKWKKLRLKILKRDNFTCQACGSKNNLDVHHKIPFRISHDNSESNLITLCHNCHIKIERTWDKIENFPI
jgi:endogenous inhibitor of DNA gyrase (YacG/DUF329 family)